MSYKHFDTDGDLRAFSIRETAERLGLSPYTVREWANEGRISSVKIFGRRLVPADEIKRLLTEGRSERKRA